MWRFRGLYPEGATGGTGAHGRTGRRPVDCCWERQVLGCRLVGLLSVRCMRGTVALLPRGCTASLEEVAGGVRRRE